MTKLTKMFALLLTSCALTLGTGCATEMCIDDSDCDCMVDPAAEFQGDVDEDGFRTCGDGVEVDMQAPEATPEGFSLNGGSEPGNAGAWAASSPGG